MFFLKAFEKSGQNSNAVQNNEAKKWSKHIPNPRFLRNSNSDFQKYTSKRCIFTVDCSGTISFCDHFSSLKIGKYMFFRKKCFLLTDYYTPLKVFAHTSMCSFR
jgi:hypothetical protein